MTTADLLHYIRALAREFRVCEAVSGNDRREMVSRALSDRLKFALSAGSSLDVAVILGCAAEMSCFPPTPVLEQCSAVVMKSNQPALCGIVWAIRYRRSRAGDRASSLHL